MAGIQYCTQYLNECGWMDEHNKKIYNKALEDYKNKLLLRLIPNLDELPSAKYSETYLAIIDIAEQLKEKKNDNR